MHKILIIIIISSILSSCSFNYFFYFPDKEFNYTSEYKFEEIFLTSKNGNKIHSLLFPSKVNPKATILILHGNAGSLSGWANIAEPFIKNNYEVLILDYQGFGISEGKPKHKNLYNDSKVAMEFLIERNNKKNTPIILYGLSIGGNMSVKIANEFQNNIKALIIEGAFTNHREIAVEICPALLKPIPFMFCKSYVNADELIAKIKIPKIIIHSSEDQTIPFWMGKKLYENASEPKQFWEIQGKHLEMLNKYEDIFFDKLDNITQ